MTRLDRKIGLNQPITEQTDGEAWTELSHAIFFGQNTNAVQNNQSVAATGW